MTRVLVWDPVVDLAEAGMENLCATPPVDSGPWIMEVESWGV
jgi:hypothetical protein